MKITDIDFYATHGYSFLHKIQASHKLLATVLIVIIAISNYEIIILGGLYGFLLTVLFFMGKYRKKILISSFYPFIFLIIFFLSIKNLNYVFLATIILKVICISTAFTLVIFTTNYKDIFKTISKFSPPIISKILFFTYRSIFILAQIIENIKTSIYLRGGIKLKKPLYSLKVIGNMIGFFIVKSIETNEKMYESMTIRGW